MLTLPAMFCSPVMRTILFDFDEDNNKFYYRIIRTIVRAAADFFLRPLVDVSNNIDKCYTCVYLSLSILSYIFIFY